MTKREAKQRACLSSALILQNALDAGWETWVKFKDSKEEEKFLVALDEIIQELFRRSGSVGSRHARVGED